MRVVVVGDVMLDEDRVGRVERMSPEAPVPVLQVDRVRYAPGGAANVARNVLSLGARCELMGVVGEDEEGARLTSELRSIGIDPGGLLRESARPTTHKLRVSAGGRQMLRLDRETTRPVARCADFVASVAGRLPGCDLLVLEDYGKGVFASGVGGDLIARARAAGVPVMVDPKQSLEPFRGADLLKPNLAEARVLVDGPSDPMPLDDRREGEWSRRKMLEKLQARLGGGEIVVTLGAEGMSALDTSGCFFDVPTRARAVYDVQGAGDTAMAALALARAAGAGLGEACRVANAAAALAVGKLGTAEVSADELRACGIDEEGEQA
jgi:D-beta-D-heptose 7-phosphate kinase/D-beta-D-heptose 1-phosphate adenosyltransferase